MATEIIEVIKLESHGLYVYVFLNIDQITIKVTYYNQSKSEIPSLR